MGQLVKTFAALLLFLLGLAVGWIAKDLDVHDFAVSKDAESHPMASRESQEVPAVNHLLQLQKLLDSNRFDAVVTGMQGLPEVQYRAMQTSLYQRAGWLLDQGQCDQQQRLFSAFSQQYQRTAAGLLLQARCQIAQQDFEAAISNLYEAGMLDTSTTDEMQIKQLLSQAVVNQDRLLRSEDKLGDLDYFYQTLLVQEPGQASYYLQLALIRQQRGDLDGAIGALLQIQHDETLGSDVRLLLQKVQREKDQIKSAADIIPLRVEGPRLIVNAVLDGQFPLRLLLDTGAALTMVSPGILKHAGYEVNPIHRQNFQTANGIVQAPIVRIGNLAIESHVESELSVGSIQLDLGAEADGLLGMNYLKHYRFSVDQAEQVLYLSPR